MRNRKNLRAFLTSFFVSLLLLALLLGLNAVDFQCRRIGFGDNKTFIFRITGKNLPLACNEDGLCYNILN